MLFIYREYDDASGEGTRAELIEFNVQEAANRTYYELAGRLETTYIKMILGTPQKEMRPQDRRSLNDNELQISSIDGVPDLSDKENI